MKKYVFSLCCLFSINALSQTLATDVVQVKVDSNLTVYLYDPPKERKENGFRVLEYFKDHIYYQITANDAIPLNPKTERSFKISMTGIRDGMINREEYKILLEECLVN
jgi:hypothetical protein